MMNLVYLARDMQEYKEAHFVIIGDGDEFFKIENSVLEYNLSNLLLLPAVEQGEFKQILAEADIGLFTLAKDHVTHNFPGKLLGYMVQNLPVLGSVNAGNDVIETIHHYNAGRVSVNGDRIKFFEEALYLLLNKEKRAEMGNNAEKMLLELFSVESAAEVIVNSTSKKIEG